MMVLLHLLLATHSLHCHTSYWFQLFLPGAIAYFLPELRKGNEHFLYFSLVLFACMMLVESLMMIVASIVPNYLMGIMSGTGIQGLMILVGGFVTLPNDIPFFDELPNDIPKNIVEKPLT